MVFEKSGSTTALEGGGLKWQSLLILNKWFRLMNFSFVGKKGELIRYGKKGNT
jgi:hypothetical protein